MYHNLVDLVDLSWNQQRSLVTTFEEKLESLEKQPLYLKHENKLFRLLWQIEITKSVGIYLLNVEIVGLLPYTRL